jgi:hypothetical protein
MVLECLEYFEFPEYLGIHLSLGYPECPEYLDDPVYPVYPDDLEYLECLGYLGIR